MKPTNAQRIANFYGLLMAFEAPATVDNCLHQARKYEKTAKKFRATSRTRKSHYEWRRGALVTARAWYGLARRLGA